MKRFTYGVYLEQPLEVADAADLAAGEPLQQLPGERRLLWEQSQWMSRFTGDGDTKLRLLVCKGREIMHASLICKLRHCQRVALLLKIKNKIKG